MFGGPPNKCMYRLSVHFAGCIYAAVNGNLDPTLSKARQAIVAASTPNLHLEKTATKWIFAVFYKGRCESLPYFLANLVNLCRTCFWMRWILSVYQVSKSETASNKKNPYGERSSSSLSYSDRSSICHHVASWLSEFHPARRCKYCIYYYLLIIILVFFFFFLLFEYELYLQYDFFTIWYVDIYSRYTCAEGTLLLQALLFTQGLLVFLYCCIVYDFVCTTNWTVSTCFCSRLCICM